MARKSGKGSSEGQESPETQTPPDGGVHESVEDALAGPGPVDRPLTDEDLTNGGLQPIRAFVRTAKSKAAMRQQRHRQKKEDEEGLKGLSVEVPVEPAARSAIRNLAGALREGSVMPADALVISDVLRLGGAAADELLKTARKILFRRRSEKHRGLAEAGQALREVSESGGAASQ